STLTMYGMSVSMPDVWIAARAMRVLLHWACGAITTLLMKNSTTRSPLRRTPERRPPPVRRARAAAPIIATTRLRRVRQRAASAHSRSVALPLVGHRVDCASRAYAPVVDDRVARLVRVPCTADLTWHADRVVPSFRDLDDGLIYREISAVDDDADVG